jgi:alpha-glucosidase/oligosaccharide 4-alpha-D-glucosyltransferase
MLYEEPGNAALRAMSSTYLWGKDFLVTPVLKAGAASAEVYFPARSAWFDFYSGARHAGGASASVALAEDHIPVYVRAGAFIPMAAVVQTTRDYSTANLELHYYHDASVRAGAGKLYDDDGETAQAYEQGKYELLHFASKLQGRSLTLRIASEVGAHYRRKQRGIALLVHNVGAQPASVKVDGKPAPFAWDGQTARLSVQLAANAKPDRTVVIELAAQ